MHAQPVRRVGGHSYEAQPIGRSRPGWPMSWDWRNPRRGVVGAAVITNPTLVQDGRAQGARVQGGTMWVWAAMRGMVSRARESACKGGRHRRKQGASAGTDMGSRGAHGGKAGTRG